MTDPWALRSLCLTGYSGRPNVRWNNSSNHNAPSINQTPGII